jgi:hypothetical protein
VRIVLAIFLGLLVSAPVALAASPTPVSTGAGGGVIRVEGDGWGTADRSAIAEVLHSVAHEILPHWPDTPAVAIVVTHTESNPIALYDRGEHGEFLVRLHASGERWHLYVYEFAHEFCHLVSNHDANTEAGMPRHNQWFEESLCEASSLFALKALATRWRGAAPGSPWAARARMAQRFHDELMAEAHRRLPEGVSAAEWLHDNEAALRRDPYQRDQNDRVAKLLLPCFERDPSAWEALAYLNLDVRDGVSSLHEYLQHWHRNAPAEHKPRVASVMAALAGDGGVKVADLPPYAMLDRGQAAVAKGNR